MKVIRLKLTNCSNCGAVFAKNVIDVCPSCHREEEKAFQVVYAFLRKQKNRAAVLAEVVEATGVEEKLIIKFLKQNRLRTSQFPQLAYPCESCGEPILEKKLCQKCSAQILTKWDVAKEQVQQPEVDTKKRPNYYRLNDNERD